MTEPMPEGVRHARPEDEDAVLALMRLAHDENGLFSMDEEKTREMIRRCTARRFALLGVIDGQTSDCPIEGVIALVIASYWYTCEHHLEEIMNFVHPDHRRSTHAKQLIAWAKWCQQGLSQEGLHVPLIMGIMTHKRLEPKIRLYQRQMPQIGAVFQVGLDTPDSFSQRRLARAT